MQKILFIIVTVNLMLLLSCKNKNECVYETPCGGNGSKPIVDLIILCDASASMGTAATSISEEVDRAIKAALDTCSVDLHVEYFGVDGRFIGKFSTGHLDYLESIYGDTILLAAGRVPFGEFRERGANAIEDLSKYYLWRPYACRAIYYISDEELDGQDPLANYVEENAETASAINMAKAKNVAVFATYLTYQHRGAPILQNYKDLTSQTGGVLDTTSATILPKGYFVNSKVFNTIVCNACNGCKNNYH